jgi:RNA polymerase sigma factor (sigma-70 family)
MARPALNRLLHRVWAISGQREGTESDRELLRRYLASHDEEAFAALVRRHGHVVIAACRQVLRESADIDDAFQATFLILLRRAKSVNWHESLASWLYAVAHRVAVRARAQAEIRRQRETSAAKQRTRSSEPADLSWREACAILHEELDKLPPQYRKVLLLCYLEGQSRDEAARNLGGQGLEESIAVAQRQAQLETGNGARLATCPARLRRYRGLRG